VNFNAEYAFLSINELSLFKSVALQLNETASMPFNKDPFRIKFALQSKILRYIFQSCRVEVPLIRMGALSFDNTNDWLLELMVVNDRNREINPIILYLNIDLKFYKMTFILNSRTKQIDYCSMQIL
jgi:hypothetical protein